MLLIGIGFTALVVLVLFRAGRRRAAILQQRHALLASHMNTMGQYRR